MQLKPLRRLIHNNHPTILDQRTRQAEQRPLPDTQVRAIRLDERVQRDAVLVVMLAIFLFLERRAVRRRVLGPHEVRSAQGVPEASVVELVEGVEGRADRTAEEDGLGASSVDAYDTVHTYAHPAV